MSDDCFELREALRRALPPHYEVGEEIGRGGMACVFGGRDARTGRAVAFKVLKHVYAGVLGPTRFLREIRLLSQLEHPGILPLLDSGHAESLFWYVMPLVEGETLQARLEREPQLPLDQVRQILSQVGAALDYAHEAGIIHRDIKPSNLFLSGDRVLLADFGIAKDLKPAIDESTTSTGLVVGTVQYMSPEQADGSGHPDRRSDVYSLGCVAYQMVAGEPPFSGASTQAVLARVRSVPAPSARVLRPELPRGVDAVIRKALAKSPADRYARAGDFAAALSDPAQLAAAAREAEAEARPLRRRLVPLLATIGVAAVAIALFLPPRRAVDANKVVVFPLGETPAGAQREGTGVVVALMIGNALAYTEPLEWIDGLPLLEARLHDDPAALTAREASQIARRAGARWYLDGTVVRQGDSATVVARLNDAVGDSVVGRASATRPTPEAAQAGLLAVNQILPRLLAPGQQMADLSVLSARRPAAVATWLQGEREYRRFNFPEALEYFRRAVDGDSALAVAALRGAQTASWLNQIGEAAALSGVAMRNLDLLPGRMADFARGLNAYVGGQADTAVFWLTRAIEANPQWTEAHMALGEVYYHLLPITTVPADSLAEVEFVAAAVDSGFSPARLHLAEIAILSGDTVRAEQAVDEFLRVAQNQASAPQRIMLQTMLDCARGGRKAVDWQRLAAAAPLDALRAAKMLSVGAAFPGCAEDGLRILFETPTLDLGYRWGAFLGLQGLLAAEGRVSELRPVVDSAVAHGLDLAVQLYVLDALAGVSLDADADDVAARTSEGDLGKAFPFSIWLAGEWHARRGDTVGVGTMQAALAEHAAATGRVADARLAAALAARRLLAEGDTAATLTSLSAVLGGMRYDQLDWGVGESLAPERLLLAQLLLARGQTREALAAAAIFDHPTPVVFLPFLPASLTLRRDAARLLGQEHAVRQFEARLAALGRRVQLAGNGSTPSTSEAP